MSSLKNKRESLHDIAESTSNRRLQVGTAPGKEKKTDRSDDSPETSPTECFRHFRIDDGWNALIRGEDGEEKQKRALSRLDFESKLVKNANISRNDSSASSAPVELTSQSTKCSVPQSKSTPLLPFPLLSTSGCCSAPGLCSEAERRAWRDQRWQGTVSRGKLNRYPLCEESTRCRH